MTTRVAARSCGSSIDVTLLLERVTGSSVARSASKSDFATHVCNSSDGGGPIGSVTATVVTRPSRDTKIPAASHPSTVATAKSTVSCNERSTDPVANSANATSAKFSSSSSDGNIVIHRAQVPVQKSAMCLGA